MNFCSVVSLGNIECVFNRSGLRLDLKYVLGKREKVKAQNQGCTGRLKKPELEKRKSTDSYHGPVVCQALCYSSYIH